MKNIEGEMKLAVIFTSTKLCQNYHESQSPHEVESPFPLPEARTHYYIIIIPSLSLAGRNSTV